MGTLRQCLGTLVVITGGVLLAPSGQGTKMLLAPSNAQDTPATITQPHVDTEPRGRNPLEAGHLAQARHPAGAP